MAVTEAQYVTNDGSCSDAPSVVQPGTEPSNGRFVNFCKVVSHHRFEILHTLYVELVVGFGG